MDGERYNLFTRICRPASDAPARLVVFSHGRSPDPQIRERVQPLTCGSEAARWFLARGFAVIAPVRPGYGRTGGTDIEADRCRPARDYTLSAGRAARAIDAALDYARTLPFIRHDRIVIVGQSAGGMASLAYGSRARPEVTALINMAGGNGGHLGKLPGNNCFPDRLADAAARFGATSRIPQLWVYAANDTYFSPEIAEAMHRAFTSAGGRAELIRPGPWGEDGHRLFLGRGGSAVWGPIVERYLASRDR